MKQLGAAELRRLAVLADADPRTVKKVLVGKKVLALTEARVRRVLAREGLLQDARESQGEAEP